MPLTRRVLPFCAHAARLVINSISKMESGRKAFRLVGGVLIQQTVGEVLPAVTGHQAMVRPILR